MEEFLKNLTTFNDHPLVAHKLTKLSDVNTGPKEVCELLTELTVLMGYEALKDLKTKLVTVQAPLADVTTPILAENFVIVPILRAGLGMVDGLRMLSPNALIGHIGLYRDEESLKPVTYYFKMPQESKEYPVIIVDPALATGGSINAAIDYLKKDGYKNIKVMAVFASNVGLDLIYRNHPDVKVYAAKYMPGGLNDVGYIVEAAGDIGDRINGTVDYRAFARK